MTKDPRWQAVAAAIEARMSALGLSQADLIRDAGVSDFTVRKLMRASQESYRPAVLHKVCRALDWSSDSIDRLLAGHQPVTRSQPSGSTDSDVAALRAQVAELAGHLDRLQAQFEAALDAATDQAKYRSVPRGQRPAKGG